MKVPSKVHNNNNAGLRLRVQAQGDCSPGGRPKHPHDLLAYDRRLLVSAAHVIKVMLCDAARVCEKSGWLGSSRELMTQKPRKNSSSFVRYAKVGSHAFTLGENGAGIFKYDCGITTARQFTLPLIIQVLIGIVFFAIQSRSNIVRRCRQTFLENMLTSTSPAEATASSVRLNRKRL